jgi:uncharacterized protein YgiM (DUF1202 family)
MDRIYAISIFLFFQCTTTLYAQEPFLFKGKVKADNINVRTDSTASSEVICSLDKDTDVEVILELYDWYKIKLPSNAPAFIKKDFATMIDDKTAKVSGDNVNIRLRPDASSPIIGRVNKDEAVVILGDKGDWYRIEPVSSSFGWIHKGFVKRQEAKLAQKSEKDKEEIVSVEGIIKPKTMKRIATHKLITSENTVYLLKGDKNSLIALSGRKVRITGKLAKPQDQEYSIIDIAKIEVLD